MDYKEKYDKAIEAVKALLNDNPFDAVLLKWANDFFPELKESEDERIRKEIKQHFLYLDDSFPDKAKWIAWLEKQGKKPQGKSALEAINEVEVDNANKVSDFKAKDWYVSKVDGKIHNIYHSDKVEPKFKVGDWVVDKIVGGFWHIDSFDKKNYQVSDVKGNYNYFPISKQDEMHLWTIQDAKDGDVLTSISFHSNCTFIFKGLDNWKFDEPNGDRVVATGYCCLSASADKMEFGIQGPDCVEVNTVKPATKIQRDLLFLKMREAGYEWNVEKKELKKIEQEPTAWSEEDEQNLQGIIDELTANKSDAPSYDYKTYDRFLAWIKSIKQRIGGEE